MISIPLFILSLLFYNDTTGIDHSAILNNNNIVGIFLINDIALINLCIFISSAIDNLNIGLIFDYLSFLVSDGLFFDDWFFIYTCLQLELSFVFAFVFCLLDYIRF